MENLQLKNDDWRDIAHLWRDVYNTADMELETAWRRALEGIVDLIGGLGVAGVVQRQLVPAGEDPDGFYPVFFSAAGIDMNRRIRVMSEWLEQWPEAPDDPVMKEISRRCREKRVVCHRRSVPPEQWEGSLAAGMHHKLGVEDMLTALLSIGPEVDLHICIDRALGEPCFEPPEAKLLKSAVEGLRPLAARYVRSHGLMPGQRKINPFERRVVKLLITPTPLDDVAASLRLDVEHLNDLASRIYAKVGVANRDDLIRMWTLGEPAQTSLSADAVSDRVTPMPDFTAHQAPITARVRQVLDDSLDLGDGGIESTARRLGMSERTLQRQLRAADTTYRELLEDVRHDHAVAMLAIPQISLTEIALRLGYSQASSFNRAIKRWTGKTPSQLRNEMTDDSD